ncbi:Uncharacterised protein [Mycobacterium tuberculosis]|nr:Uncharacterised protein [Mycobacterium tuberculosis]
MGTKIVIEGIEAGKYISLGIQVPVISGYSIGQGDVFRPAERLVVLLPECKEQRFDALLLFSVKAVPHADVEGIELHGLIFRIGKIISAQKVTKALVTVAHIYEYQVASLVVVGPHQVVGKK